MTGNLTGKRVAVLVTDGFEQTELTHPRARLAEAGAEVEIVSPKSPLVKGWNHADWGDSFEVDRTLAEARASDYDALVLPGGVLNPDALRTDEQALDFVRAFAEVDKPIAAICHGPWLLIDAGLVEGRMVTSYRSIRRDLENAGADWADKPLVKDHRLLTSRSPDDLEDFSEALVAALEETQPFVASA